MNKSSRELIHNFLKDGWVLVIEPNNNYRASIKQFLSNLKISKVVLTHSTQEALRKLHFTHHRWVLLIAEWNLPEMNGLQLLRSLRKEEQFRELAFLLTSVENLRGDVVLATEVGVDAYLLKPFSYEEMVTQLELVARSRLLVNDVNRDLEDAERALDEQRPQDAKQVFLEVLKSKPDSARALHGLARITEAAGDETSAVALLMKAIACNSKYIGAYRTLLGIHDRNKSFPELLSVGLALHQFSPDNPTYCLKIANAYLNLKKPDESEKFFRKAIRLSPKLAEAFKGLGDVFMLREDYEKAMQNYHKALDLDATDSSILNSIALTYIRTGKIKEGIQKYQAALRVDPDNASILFNLGYAFERSGDVENAKQYYMKSLFISPKFEKPKKRLEFLQSNNPSSDGKSVSSSVSSAEAESEEENL